MEQRQRRDQILSYAAVLAAALATSTLLQGCGGGGPSPSPPPSPGPKPGPPPPPPSPSASNYDGNPTFMLDDKGVGLKAFSYNPLFLADPRCMDKPSTKATNCSNIINDDVSADWAAHMWNSSGRDDIGVMSTLGATAVRLYGNDPRFSKKNFMDYAIQKKMKVVTGLSNYPYVNQQNGCVPHAKYDCFKTINESYYQVLTVGGFAQNGYYHNALEIVSLFNEPDIWMAAPWSSPNNYIKGLITAFDGFLSAEKAAGIKKWKNGRLPKITISWSYAILGEGPGSGMCTEAHYIKNPNRMKCGPSVGFMNQFYNALQDLDGTVQYKPVNDLKKAYSERWITSLQPFVPAPQVYKEVLQPDFPALRDLQVYFGEYNPAVDMCGAYKPECKQYGKEELHKDLTTILTNETWLEKKTIGLSFFSYTEADNKRLKLSDYTKNHEMQYGLFNFTKDAPWKTGYITGDPLPSHPINCIGWKTKDLGEAIASAFGGSSTPTLHCPTTSAGRQTSSALAIQI